MIAEAHSLPARSIARFPERLTQRQGAFLAASDAAISAAVSLLVFNRELNALPDALITAAIVCGVFWQSGLYKRSYAIYAHDEAYYAFTVAGVSAVPVVLLLAGIGQVPFGTIAVAMLLCALATAVLHVRFLLDRRGRAEASGGISSITPAAWHDRESSSDHLSKRLFDCAIGSVALLVFLPVMLLCALAVAIESGRPILFTQERVGENCKRFRIYKFRTMRADSGGDWARPGDSRITKTGALLRRTSLDELPQLFNVLRGDMSLVGPRPEMTSFARTFSSTIQHYDQRHVVAPGVTGWAQVYLKRNLQPDDVPEVLPYDLFYVEHSSRLLDTVIILKTAIEVLFHRAV